MRRCDFRELEARLLRNGIAPRHVKRTVVELEDHYRDLVEEATDKGVPVEDARARAAARLGDLDSLVAGILGCPELRSWAYRYPLLALFVYPLACLLALPAVPVIAGVDRASELARWGASFLLAGLFTATMLLVLQLAIVFG